MQTSPQLHNGRWCSRFPAADT